MINYIKGDLFTTTDKIIAHGCNAQQVMASGVAKQINEKYPKAFADYYIFIDKEMREVGLSTQDFLGYVIYSAQPDGKTILNCITQDNYGRNKEIRYVSYDAVDKCMEYISYYLKEMNYDSISMPKIGAGLGGGNWEVIEAIIKHRLDGHIVNVYHLD